MRWFFNQRTGPDLEGSAAAFGLPSEAIENFKPQKPFYLNKSHWPICKFFISLRSQWKRHPFGGVIGLDYSGVESAARLSGLEMTPEKFEEIQILEDEWLKNINKKK